MEKKENNSISSTSAHKIFGANNLQITGQDSSRLIGSIIEKGISDDPQNKPLSPPTLPPKVTVLPFPMARHRSHGPHWGPIRSTNIAVDVDDGEVEDDEDTDLIDYDPISAYANPVQRKQKRGLNLSQWKELMPSDNLLDTDKLEGNRQRLLKRGKEKKGAVPVDNVDKKDTSSSLDDNNPIEVDTVKDLSSIKPLTEKGEGVSTDIYAGSLTSACDMEIDNSHQLHAQENVRDASSSFCKSEAGSAETKSRNGVAKANLEKMDNLGPTLAEMLSHKKQKPSRMVSSSSSSLNNLKNEQASMSLESEIDAENLARLKSMSPEEVAEAQTEIMEKMNPALINLLKKRGERKLRQQNLSSSEEVINGELRQTSENQAIIKSHVSPHLRSDNSDMTTITSTDSKSGPNKDMVQDLCPASGNLWSSWSERVEAVRGLRFSLEGSIITDDTETGKGDISIDTGNAAFYVTERDILRTEGDPAAVGYTIKEAVQLTRSVIPGQRALALHLLASVLDKAMRNIQQNQVGCTMANAILAGKLIDWEAIWAYTLGPEPELVLSLRMCLDDNHSSVVLACAKVIHCALSCELNDNFFDISEKIPLYEMDIFSAPVFRSKPEMDDGLLHGCFWKYNAKPSNILTFADDVIDEDTEGTHTIQDDIVVAGQDFVAGLVRMGILDRMLYLLEAVPNVALEECIISILIAIARHSPTCANAIMKFPGLVQTIVHKFATGNATKIYPSKIRSVTLLKVLAKSEKKNCMKFIENGSFQAMTQHLFRYTASLDHWVKTGEENCKLSSALMVEQLRFWRICISYGFCISYFSDIFPALCLWLNPPSFGKLEENNVLVEFLSVSREAYLVLEALARRLPSFHSQNHLSNQASDSAVDGLETWSWSFVIPMVDLALKWTASTKDPHVSKYFEKAKGIESDFVFQDFSCSSFLWVFSAIMYLLAALLERVNPKEISSSQGSGRNIPWLPEFVPKVGLDIIKNQILSVNSAEEQEDFDADCSFIGLLLHLRQQTSYKSSLAAVCCLHGLLCVVASTDNLIGIARSSICCPPSQGYNFSREGDILQDGLLKRSLVEWRFVLGVFMKLIGNEWHFVQSIETFGRGGPAPGVGLGWGASGGGFWSMTVLLAQTDARLIVNLLEILPVVSGTELMTDGEMGSAVDKVNSILEACLIIGPRDRVTMEKALDILFQVPILKSLDLCIQRYLQLNKRAKPFRWEYKKEEYSLFSEILSFHFKNRWLSVKKKLKAVDGNKSSGNKTFKGSVPLDTIHEDTDTSNVTSQGHYCTSLITEWAHQRLPLPMHWFLSPISLISDRKIAGLPSASEMPISMKEASDTVEVAKGGLFLLLAMEAMSIFLSTDIRPPIQNVPLVWKLHSLSVILLAGMDVLDDNKSRDIYEALQDIYGQLLDEARFTKNASQTLDGDVNLMVKTEKKSGLEFLSFQSEIHESYSVFLETLVEQFAAVSYGNLFFGRQVSVYLHRCTEAAVRFSAWTALSNARVLEILPPLEKCIAEAEGYLDPIEENEDILEAYVKSWVSGALDRAAARGSMAYALVLHHISSFVFLVHDHDKKRLRNKLVKSLLRDYSQKQKHEGMILELIQYCKPSTALSPKEGLSFQSCDIEKRFELLAEACDQNSILLDEVKKLRSAFVEKLKIL